MDEFAEAFAFLESSPLHTGRPRPEPKPEPAPRVTNQFKEAFDFLESSPVNADERTLPQAYLNRRLREGASWDAVGPELKAKFGIEPDQVRQGYQLEQAKRKYEGAEESDFSYGVKRLPFVGAGYSTGQALRVRNAMKRFQEGTADQGDMDLIAQHERMGEIERGKSTGEAVKDELTRIPAMVAEFAAAGPLLSKVPGGLAGRAAAIPLIVPSMSPAEGAIQRSMDQGGSPLAPENLAPAYVRQVAAAAVLGTLQNPLMGKVPTRLGRAAVGGTVGVGEQAAADAALTLADQIVPEAFSTRTRFGTLGQLARSEENSVRNAVVQTLTFATFAGLHGKPHKPILEDFTRKLDAAAGQGKPLPDAIRDAVPPEAAKLPETARPTGEKVDTVTPEPEPNSQPLRNEAVPEIPTDPLESLSPEELRSSLTRFGNSVRTNDPAKLLEMVRSKPSSRAWAESLAREKALEAPESRSEPVEPEPLPEPVREAERPADAKLERPAAVSGVPETETAVPDVENAQQKAVSPAGGRETTVVVPGGEPIPARYELRELADVRASHEVLQAGGLRNRAKAGEYPESLQPRDYDNAPGEQMKVLEGANRLEPRYLVSEHPDATNGPPTITRDGNVVINGNGRQMMLEGSRFRGTYPQYREHLKAEAAKYGLDPAEIDRMKEPALYRVVDLDPAGNEASAFARAGNVSMTQAQSPERTAAAHRELITDGILGRLRLEGDETFSQAVKSDQGDSFRQALRDRLPPSIRDQYFDADGKLTAAGEELVQNMMLAKIMPVELIEALGRERKQLLNNVEAAIPQLLRLRAKNAHAFNVTPEIVEALEYLGRNPDAKDATYIQNSLDQLDIFSGQRSESLSPGGRMMLDFLMQRQGTRQFRSKLVQVLNGERATGGLLDLVSEPKSFDPVENVAKLLGVKLRPGATFGAMKEVQDAIQSLKADGYSQRAIQESIAEAAGQDPAVGAGPEPGRAADGAEGQFATVANSGGGLADAAAGFLKGEGGFMSVPELAAGAGAVKRAVVGRRPEKDPAGFDVDPDPNPDMPRSLPDHDTMIEMYRTQHGHRAANDHQIALGAYAYGKSMVTQTANAWRFAHTADPFAADPVKGDTITAAMNDPAKLAALSPEQQQFVEMWRAIREKRLDELDAAGVKQFRDSTGQVIELADLKAEGYFPRSVVPEADVWTAFKNVFRPGAKQSHRFERVYKTEADGVKAGVKYKPALDAIRDFLEGTGREIIDHRLANDPLLGGQDLVPAERRKLFAQNKDVLDALPQAERDQLAGWLAMQARQSATGNVNVAPAFKGKKYSEEAKAEIERMFGGGGKGLKLLGAINQEFRNAVLGGDFSYTFLQLQQMMFSNPARWIRTVAKIPQSLWNPKLMEETIAKRPDMRQAMDELVQAGGTIGTLPEQTGNLGTGRSVVERIPGVGQVYKSLNRTFGTIMDLAKLELWQANRPANKAEWPRAVEALENSLGQGRMEQLGMSPGRALAERLVLLAPSYYRAHLKLLAQATQRGAPGFLARKQLGSLAAGSALLAIAALLGLKEDGTITEDEFEERLNPTRGKFLAVPVPVGDKQAEVGLGGFYLNLLRTIANGKRYADGQAKENPAVHWYKGHAGVLVRTGQEVLTGKDYSGRDTSLPETASRAVLPVAAQQAIYEDADPEQKAAVAGTTLFGLRSFPGSESGRNMEDLRKAALSRFGKRYEDLTVPQQAVLARANPAPVSKSPTARVKAIEADELRVERLTKAVSPATRKLLKEFGHPLPSFDPALSVGGTKVPLPKAAQERYESLLAEEYDRVVEKWPVDKLRGFDEARRQDYIRRSLEHAKEVARARLIRERSGRK